MIDQIDASVAPPSPITWTPGATARRRSGSVTGIQSPLSRARRSEPGSPSGRPVTYSTSMSSSAGTEFQIVTPSRARSSSQ